MYTAAQKNKMLAARADQELNIWYEYLSWMLKKLLFFCASDDKISSNNRALRFVRLNDNTVRTCTGHLCYLPQSLSILFQLEVYFVETLRNVMEDYITRRAHIKSSFFSKRVRKWVHLNSIKAPSYFSLPVPNKSQLSVFSQLNFDFVYVQVFQGP